MSPDEPISIEHGETVYNEHGDELGIVGDFNENGFDVKIIDQSADIETPDSNEDVTGEDEKPGKEFGEGYLMWRCENCGEMGDLEDGYPDECPNCGASKENIAKALED